MSEVFLWACGVIASSAFVVKRLLRYMRYQQQEEYESSRFLRWVGSKRAFDSRGTLLAILGSLFSLWSPFLAALMALSLIALSWMEENPCREGKLRLQLTARAKRLFAVAALLYSLSQLLVSQLSGSWSQWWLWQIALFQLVPIDLVLAALALKLHERSLQKKFLREAAQKIKAYRPFIIGITGSYGKTSTKHSLSHILQVTLGPTFWPAKGINTLMGNTREIRERLCLGHRFAVIEMGAYYQGSIKRLCELTPPRSAIITGIGLAHLERYKSQEAIECAKSELAQALPSDGLLVCNGDNEGARRIAEKHKPARGQTLLYGFNNALKDLDCHVHDWKVTAEGTSFKISWRGKTYEGFSIQYGQACLSNLAGAFTMAVALGADPEYVLAAIGHLETVDNRLKVSKEGPYTYFRDAYNSNPEGFQAALEVLKAYPVKRRLIMTPGMIEFGSMQSALNQKLGKIAATICDLALIVGDTNREDLVKGLLEGGMSLDRIEVCSTREEAFAKLKELAQEGDGILIENDLTDLYEITPRF